METMEIISQAFSNCLVVRNTFDQAFVSIMGGVGILGASLFLLEVKNKYYEIKALF